MTDLTDEEIKYYFRFRDYWKSPDKDTDFNCYVQPFDVDDYYPVCDLEFKDYHQLQTIVRIKGLYENNNENQVIDPLETSKFLNDLEKKKAEGITEDPRDRFDIRNNDWGE